MAQCEHIKPANGERCGVQGGSVQATDAGLLCLWHDPNRKEEADRARKKGGKRNRIRVRTVDPGETPPAPKTLEDVVRWASWATYAVATGEIDSRTAHEIGYLCNALERSLEKVNTAREVAEIQKQLTELRSTKVRSIR